MISGKDVNFNDETHVLTINGEKHAVGDPGEIDALDVRVSAVETSKLNKNAMQFGSSMFPAADVGLQTIVVTFATPFENIPKVLVTWDDLPPLQTYFKYPLKIMSVTKEAFTVRAERLIASENWYISYLAVDLS